MREIKISYSFNIMYFTISYQKTTDVSEYCEANKKIFAKYAELTVKVIQLLYL